MKLHILLLAASCALVPLLSHAQGNQDAGSYSPYSFVTVTDTPAPNGYRPFYISHYGRHGSRYLTASHANKAYDALRKAGTLTLEGQALMEEVKAVHDVHKGHAGKLSARGEGEHRQLAARMYQRFPEVFDGSRVEVNARSSSVGRCRESMENYTDVLQKCAPYLRMDKSSGIRYFKLFSRLPSRPRRELRRRDALEDSLLCADICPDSVAARFCQARGDAAIKLCRELFIYGADCACIGLDDRIRPRFCEAQRAALALDLNAGIYARYMDCREFGEELRRAARPLLKSILAQADEAMQPDSRVAAHLRFGHDSGLGPLASLMGLEGFAPSYSIAEGRYRCPSAELLPMACNLQMVFYRAGEEQPVLVKLLLNERETLIYGLQPFIGPYYEWEKLRNYLNTLVYLKPTVAM